MGCIMKILLSGCNGRMGEAISRRIGGDEIVAGVTRSGKSNGFDYPVYDSFDKVTEDYDVIIDFSVAANVDSVIDYVDAVEKPLVMGTTGLDDSQIEKLEQLAKKVPILFSHNTSFGVSVLLALLKKASSLLSDGYDIELIEKHDRNKLDSPSGTSHLIVEAIECGANKKYNISNGRFGKNLHREDNEIGIHSIRAGRIASEHYISFINEDETIEINHIAKSFDIYGVGAIKGAKILLEKEPNIYSMEYILGM